MAASNPAVPPTLTPLKLGLIADAEELPRFVALLSRPTLQLAAQARARSAEGFSAGAWFDDTRIMLQQAGLQAVVLATSTRAAHELSLVAIAAGVHVLRLPPLGRNFAEAVEVADAVRGAAVVYHVPSWWELVSADVRWALRLAEGFRALFSNVRVNVEGPAVQSWHSSAAAAGGGALLHDAYAAIESLVAIRGLPESVVATIGSCRRRSDGPQRETEDVAAALLRYEGGGVATIQATWDIGPHDYRVLHHGSDATVVLTEQSVAVRKADDSLLDERTINARAALLELELARFETAVRTGRRDARDDAVLSRHLATAALLDALYLSARTGQPESPRKLYEVLGWPEPTLGPA
ncbi:MAG: Gfo/Idh/MocA family oxidoreductase [Phycisphaerae bacterium]